MNKRLWNLVGKQLAGEASTDEMKELNEVQLSSNVFADQIEVISQWWHSGSPSTDKDAEKAFQKHVEKMKSQGIILPDALNDSRKD